MYFTGKNLSVVPLPSLPTTRFWRRLVVPYWLLRNGSALLRQVARADAVCALIPGDIAVLGTILAVVMRKPLLVRYTNNWAVQKTFMGRLERWLLERIATERAVVLAAGEADHQPSPGNIYVRWIFSTSLTENDLRVRAAQRRIPQSKPLRLITVARQVMAKGTDVLIQSLTLLGEKIPSIALDVVGDGPALPKFKRMVDELGLRNNVTFHGSASHETVLELLQQADLFCLPTESEGFTKAILEALACGLPVVTTRLPVLVRLVGARCGVLVDDRTPEGFARAITECLSDPDRYQKMSQEAIRTARSVLARAVA